VYHIGVEFQFIKKIACSYKNVQILFSQIKQNDVMQNTITAKLVWLLKVLDEGWSTQLDQDIQKGLPRLLLIRNLYKLNCKARLLCLTVCSGTLTMKTSHLKSSTSARHLLSLIIKFYWILFSKEHLNLWLRKRTYKEAVSIASNKQCLN
jgi:hypothetical protein